jgi:hypothetical protein
MRLRIKCEECHQDFEIANTQFDPNGDFYCSQACEEAASQNLLRAIFGEPVIKTKSKKPPMPTEEELEFAKAEMDLMIKNYRLEDSANSMDKLFELTQEMIDSGFVKKSAAGIEKAWDIIFREHPDIKEHFDKFTSILFKETLRELQQNENLH